MLEARRVVYKKSQDMPRYMSPALREQRGLNIVSAVLTICLRGVK